MFRAGHIWKAETSLARFQSPLSGICPPGPSPPGCIALPQVPWLRRLSGGTDRAVGIGAIFLPKRRAAGRSNRIKVGRNMVWSFRHRGEGGGSSGRQVRWGIPWTAFPCAKGGQPLLGIGGRSFVLASNLRRKRFERYEDQCGAGSGLPWGRGFNLGAARRMPRNTATL